MMLTLFHAAADSATMLPADICCPMLLPLSLPVDVTCRFDNMLRATLIEPPDYGFAATVPMLSYDIFLRHLISRCDIATRYS